MPDIKQTLQNLKAKGRVQGPAQPRKLDRSGQPRRPDEHLKRSAQEAIKEEESEEPVVSAPVAPVEPPAPRKKPVKEEITAKAPEVIPPPEAPQPIVEPQVSITPPILEIVESKPAPAQESIVRQGAERAPIEALPTPIPGPALTLVSEPTKVESSPANQLTESARELAAIMRLLRADTCYYLAFLEMRDPVTGVVDLPHLAYAELFAVRKNTVAPMIKRLIDAGALTVERAYDPGSRTTWAYRVAERNKLAERAPAPGAL